MVGVSLGVRSVTMQAHFQASGARRWHTAVQIGIVVVMFAGSGAFSGCQCVCQPAVAALDGPSSHVGAPVVGRMTAVLGVGSAFTRLHGAACVVRAGCHHVRPHAAQLRRAVVVGGGALSRDGGLQAAAFPGLQPQDQLSRVTASGVHPRVGVRGQGPGSEAREGDPLR